MTADNMSPVDRGGEDPYPRRSKVCKTCGRPVKQENEGNQPLEVQLSDQLLKDFSITSESSDMELKEVSVSYLRTLSVAIRDINGYDYKANLTSTVQ